MKKIALSDIRKSSQLQPSHRFGPVFEYGDTTLGGDVEMENLDDVRDMAGEAGRNLTDEEIVANILAQSSDEENDAVSSDDSWSKMHATSRLSPTEGGSGDNSASSSDEGSPRMQMDAPISPPPQDDVEMSGSSSSSGKAKPLKKLKITIHTHF